MADYQWIRIRSWHVVLTPTRAINGYRTRCGRNASGAPVDALPSGEKSCESCLRLVVMTQEWTWAARDDDGSTWPESVP